MMAWFRRAVPDRSDRSRPAPTGAPGGETPPALHTSLSDVVAVINARAGHLPVEAVVRSRRLTDTLGEIVDTSAVRPLDVYAVIAVRSTLDDYLPTTLQSYLAVDPERREVRSGSGLSPTDSLLQQIDILQTSASATLLAAREQDANALMTQGSFLETKFSRSDLDL